MAPDRYPRNEERINAATHGIGAALGIAGLVWLLGQAESTGRAGSTSAVAVYGTALVALFLFSALHHAVRHPRAKQVLLAFDHGGIYLLIAGTYTPFCLLMPEGREWTLLALIWALAAGGITVQAAAFLTGRGRSYERVAFLFYLAMGWIPILWAGKDVLAKLAPSGLGLLVAGGLAFTIGVVFYLWKRLPYAHALWHLFVVGGTAFHFFSIAFYVVPA